MSSSENDIATIRAGINAVDWTPEGPKQRYVMAHQADAAREALDALATRLETAERRAENLTHSTPIFARLETAERERDDARAERDALAARLQETEGIAAENAGLYIAALDEAKTQMDRAETAEAELTEWRTSIATEALQARVATLETARDDAERILTPPMFGGERLDDGEWQLARIQWHYDHGDKERAEAMLKDMNAVRSAMEKPPLDIARAALAEDNHAVT